MKSSEPLITTIIPTFRRPALLRRAIKSVLNQTFPNFRVCVYDNASGDDTPGVVQEFMQKDSRVSYYCHPENIGATNNFIFGMSQVETPLFSLLSDDDVLLPNFYEVALKGFEKHPQARFSATGTVMMDGNGYVLDMPILQWQSGYYVPPHGLVAMCRNSHPIWTGVLYHRDVIDLLNIRPDFFEDKYFNLTIARRYPFVITHTPGAILLIDRSTFSQANRFNLFIVPILEYFIRHLVQDNNLDVAIRNNCKHILTDDILKTALIAGMAAIVRNNFAMTEPACNILRRYFLSDPKSLIYFLMLKCCKTIPPVRYSLQFIYRIRSKLIKLQNHHLQIRYGPFADYLQC